MKFIDLKVGDTFYLDKLLFVKISPVLGGYNSCCITKGDLRIVMRNAEVILTEETKERHSIIYFKDLEIGDNFTYNDITYKKTSLKYKAVSLADGHVKTFNNYDQVCPELVGIFKYEQ